LAYIGGGWGGSTVGIEKADLVLEMSRNNPRLKTNEERPVDFNFGLYECSLFNISFGKKSLWELKNASVSYRVSEGNDDQYSVDSGDLTIPVFGEFKVKTGLISCNSENAEVYLGLESQEHAGVINLDGSTGYAEGSLVELEAKLENYSLRDWIDPRARRFLNGKIDIGTGTFKMNVGDIESFDITTEISSRVIRVKDFEFLTTLVHYLEDDDYANPLFTDKSSMTMRRTNSRIDISNIEIRQNDQLIVKGDFSINERNVIKGRLKVGLPLMSLSPIKIKRVKAVFSDDDGEYIWADVKLGGEVSVPKDDLGEQLSAATIKRGSEVPLFEQKFEELSE